MTDQKKMASLLANLGIPHKKIHCYGSQIVITCWSKDAAEKFSLTVSRFAKIRGIIESRDDNADNQAGAMMPDHHAVWRLFAAL